MEDPRKSKQSLEDSYRFVFWSMIAFVVVLLIAALSNV